jgi:hypothetical protein
MEPFKALIVPLKKPTLPPGTGGGGGGGEHPDHDLPLFPFHPIVVPPGGNWPGEPPITGGGGEGEPPKPNHDLPLFPFHPIVVPPGGNWPTEPPPTGEGGEGEPSHPINLPPSDNGYWVFVFVPGVGWSWVAITPQPLPPNETHPQPK